MRTFQSKDGKKFWNIDVSEKRLTVTAGKVGTKGEKSTEKHQWLSDARAAARKLIRKEARHNKLTIFSGRVP